MEMCYGGAINLLIDCIVAGGGRAAVGITVLTWATDPGGSLASFIDKRDSTGV